MAIVLLNGDVTGVVYPASTWGELLEVIDEQRAVCQDVVTVVRLDGVDLPAFRSAEALSQPIAANTEVFVETAQPADLIQETLDQAETVAKTIVEAAMCLGGAYRGKDVPGANKALPDFADSLGSLVVVTSAVAHGANVDLNVVGDGRIPAVQMINNLITHVDTLLKAQIARDWNRVADVIEYDIASTLRRWPLVLKGIRQAAPILVKTAA